MAQRVSVSLKDHPDHAAIIGDLLLGYGEMEFAMLGLVGLALGEDVSQLDTTARVIFRLRGANDRLNVADALIRPFMTKQKLLGQYCQWFGAMRRCRVIRNQYAHCGWSSDEKGRLTFLDLEEAGGSVEGTAFVNPKPIDLDLLKEQQAFFRYTIDVLLYLLDEGRFRCDRRRRHGSRYPKPRAVPKLHSPLD